LIRQSTRRQSSFVVGSQRNSDRMTVLLDVFGIGEHHRRGYLDSAPSVP